MPSDDPAAPDPDELWASMLSLADADEFVRVAASLPWELRPRGFDNTDLHQRYGDGILPWIAARLDADGVLHNRPWCVVPCLLACGSREAFALVWRVVGIDGRTAWGGAGAERDLVALWMRRHPEVALAELERLAPHDARARAHLRAAGRRAAPEATADVLALLDACAARLFATRVRLVPPAARRDVRAIAARAGDDWGLALEWIDGERPTGLFAAQIAGVAYGSRVRGVIDGAALTRRPVIDLHGATLDARLGPAELALPPLALPAAATIVAVVPGVVVPAVPSDAAAIRALAAALSSPATI